MKIFTSAQIRAWDLQTIKEQNITSTDLMERAATSCFQWLTATFPTVSSYIIFCGPGNNGGDDFALASLLQMQGFAVTVFTDLEMNFSAAALYELKKIRRTEAVSILDFKDIKTFHFRDSIIIDALFGVGLNRPLESSVAMTVDFLNALTNVKISLDLPSGLSADEYFSETQRIVKASHTLTFQHLKRTLLHPETAVFAGKIHLLDIGLSSAYSECESALNFAISMVSIRKMFQPRNPFSHKGSYGSAVIVGGSFGKMGAAVLAAKSALRAGAGLTFVVAPTCGYEILQSTCPEAMFIAGGKEEIESININEDQVVGLGPGLGTSNKAAATMMEFLRQRKKPVVLDADALNIISAQKDALHLIPRRSVITPHPKEFERLFGKCENSFDRLTLGIKKAKELQIYIVLKDHHTQIITPEGKVYYNTTGNAGMAKGGSGDALLGMVTALLAQGYLPQEAAVLGVWLHGKAGDFAAEKYSMEAMLPSDHIEEIGTVFKTLNKKSSSLTEKDS